MRASRIKQGDSVSLTYQPRVYTDDMLRRRFYTDDKGEDKSEWVIGYLCLPVPSGPPITVRGTIDGEAGPKGCGWWWLSVDEHTRLLVHDSEVSL